MSAPSNDPDLTKTERCKEGMVLRALVLQLPTFRSGDRLGREKAPGVALESTLSSVGGHGKQINRQRGTERRRRGAWPLRSPEWVEHLQGVTFAAEDHKAGRCPKDRNSGVTVCPGAHRRWEHPHRAPCLFLCSQAPHT